MSPIPARFPSLLTRPLPPAPTVSEYSPHDGSEYGYLTLQDRAVAPTPGAVQRRSPQQEYVTLTITLPSEEVYTTTILLGDSIPTAALPTDPIQQTATQPTLTAAAPQNPSSGGNIAGIVIGVLGSVCVLAGIYYVYLLRARQLHKISSGTSTITRSSSRRKKHKKKKKKKKKSTPKAPLFTFKLRFGKKRRRRSRRSSMSTTGPGAPAAPPAPGPPPAPPPDDGPPPEAPPPPE